MPARAHNVSPMSQDTITILLVEDDDGQASLIERNLKRAGLTNNFKRLCDGQEMLDYMAETDGHPEGSLVVLLDINMPRVNGVEVLQHLKSNPETASIPVIMLTTTDDPREVERCYRAGCNVYITKPVEYDAFIDAVKRLGLFLQIVKPPAKIKK